MLAGSAFSTASRSSLEDDLRKSTKQRRRTEVVQLISQNRTSLARLPLAPSFGMGTGLGSNADAIETAGGAGEGAGAWSDDPSCSEAVASRAQALKDLERESLLLNGVAFDGNVEIFIAVLKRVASHLTYVRILRCARACAPRVITHHPSRGVSRTPILPMS